MNCNITWVDMLNDILEDGKPVDVRGFKTLELLHHTIVINMSAPIITVPARKLNYRFMAAEAEWMINGDDKLAPLTKYNKKMANYSDDGITLTGAYGPKIVAQSEYVVRTLLADQSSRQAVLTIWERTPAPSKDIPCTILMQFLIRDSFMDTHVYMRSSDAWLGVPYDIFSFSVVSTWMLAMYNSLSDCEDVLPRNLYLTAGSRHLYEQHYKAAEDIVRTRDSFPVPDPAPRKIPPLIHDPYHLSLWLQDMQEGGCTD